MVRRPPRTRAFTLRLTAVAGQRSQADKFRDPLVGKRADLRQLGHQPRHGTIGNALDGTETLIQFLPQRIGGNQLSDGQLQSTDLALQQGERFAKRLQSRSVTRRRWLRCPACKSVSWRRRIMKAFNCCCLSDAGRVPRRSVWFGQTRRSHRHRWDRFSPTDPWPRRNAAPTKGSPQLPGAGCPQQGEGPLFVSPVASMATKCAPWL